MCFNKLIIPFVPTLENLLKQSHSKVKGGKKLSGLSLSLFLLPYFLNFKSSSQQALTRFFLNPQKNSATSSHEIMTPATVRQAF